jgi:hypothetical protein
VSRIAFRMGHAGFTFRMGSRMACPSIPDNDKGCDPTCRYLDSLLLLSGMLPIKICTGKCG